MRANRERNYIPTAGFHPRSGLRRLAPVGNSLSPSCVTRLNRPELWVIADMRNRSASTVDQIDEKLVKFHFLNGAVDRSLHDSCFRRPGIPCDWPQELSEPVNHFSRYIHRVPSRRRSFSQKGSGFVVCAQQLNRSVVINCPSNRNILQGSDVFLLRSQAAS